MRNRRDDERYGYGRDDFDRFRDRDYDRDSDRDRAWSRDEDMGGSHWSGASGRGGYHGGNQGRGGYGYGGYGYGHGGGWGGGFGGGEREYGGMNRYDRVYGRRDFGDDDYERRDFERRDFERDYDDRPRNLGARDYETRHFGGGGGFGPMGRQRMQSPLGGRGGMGIGSGSDLGFSYRGHEGRGDVDERGPHYGKGPKGYKRTDERIREEVCECIARQGHIDASDVEVKVENGTVILTGTVAQRHHKRVLEQMVERVHGVDDVHNELRLKREESLMRGPQNGDQQPRSSQMPNGKNARA